MGRGFSGAMAYSWRLTYCYFREKGSPEATAFLDSHFRGNDGGRLGMMVAIGDSPGGFSGGIEGELLS